MQESSHSDEIQAAERIGFTEYLSLSVLLALSLVLLAQVFSRYLLSSPLGWTEEVARYLLIILTFLGASIGFRKGSHISFVYVLNLLPTRLHRVAAIVLTLLNLSFLFFLAYSTAVIIPRLQHFELSSIEVSISYLYVIIFMAMMFCIFAVFQNLIQQLSVGKPSRKS